MKKVLFLALFISFFSSCDDGDIQVETIDFDNVDAISCTVNGIIYKTKDNEALLLQIPASSFANEVTTTPRMITIDGDKKMVYRSYNGTIGTENVCAVIPASTPLVEEEWITTSGIIEVTTTANIVENTSIDSPNATKIDKFNHLVTLKNFVFSKPNGNQQQNNFIFGTYQTTATTLPFNFDEDAEKSTCSNKIYNFSGSEAITLDSSNYASLFNSTLGIKTALISSDNKVTYVLYNNEINNTLICNNTIPTALETWTAVDGVTSVSGIIEVETTQYSTTTLQHTIHLKKVVLKKGNNTFTLGDDYVMGSIFVGN